MWVKSRPGWTKLKTNCTLNVVLLKHSLPTPVSYTHLDVYKRQVDTCFKLLKQIRNAVALLSTGCSTHLANVYHRSVILELLTIRHMCFGCQVALSVVALRQVLSKWERVKLPSFYVQLFVLAAASNHQKYVTQWVIPSKVGAFT